MAPPGIGTEVEGVHAVAAAVAAGRVSRLFVERGRTEVVGSIIDAAGSGGVQIEVVEDVADLATTSAPQGVVARCRPIDPVPLDAAVARVTPAALAVLDHLEDPRNVGAVARTALAAGFGGLVLSGRRAAPLGAAAFKVAAGAFEHLDLVVVSSVAAAVDDLRRMAVWTVGLDASGERQLFGLELLTEPVALVIGAEGKGLGKLVAERVDVVATIPIDPRIESLNASVAAALALFEVARVRAVGR